MVLPLLHFCDAVLLAYNEKYILVFILFLNIHTNVCIYYDEVNMKFVTFLSKN